MNYPQIMSPVPFASKSWGSCPPAPIGAPPMRVWKTKYKKSTTGLPAVTEVSGKSS